MKNSNELKGNQMNEATVITELDIARTIKAFPDYPAFDILRDPRTLETCNVVLALHQRLLKPRQTLNKYTTGIRVDFEQIIGPTRYVGKSHMLVVYHTLGYNIVFDSAHYYRCNVQPDKKEMKKLLAAARRA